MLYEIISNYRLCVHIHPGMVLPLPLTVDGGVARHGFGRCVVVWVRAVQEGLSPLALWERRVKHQPRTRLRIHGTAAWWRAIFWIEADGRKEGKVSFTSDINNFLKSCGFATTFYLSAIVNSVWGTLNAHAATLQPAVFVVFLEGTLQAGDETWDIIASLH